MENKKSSLREKEAVIKEVKENDNHDFLSFFVCRNPVAHMLSVYNHLKKFVENGAWERFHGAKHRISVKILGLSQKNGTKVFMLKMWSH